MKVLVEVPPAVHGPSTLPPFAAQCSVILDPGLSSATFNEIAIPDELRHALPKRQLQFRAGRYCAQQALRKLHPGERDAVIGRTPEGAPIWPEAIVGSITHTDEYASAAVALARDTQGLGIDTQRVISSQQAERISSLVLLPAEAAQPRGAIADHVWVTLVFAAKEALFKCVYPLVGRFFHYPDAALIEVDVRTGVLRLALERSLSPEFGAGRTIEGRFQLDGPLVHVGVWLPGLAQ
jgi:enterobactin synthetase component D